LGDFDPAIVAWLALIPACALAVAGGAYAYVLRRRLRAAKRHSAANEGLANAMNAALNAHAMGVIALPHGPQSDGATRPGPATMVALPGLHKLFGLPEDRPVGFNDIATRFALSSRDALVEALARLRETGVGFDLELNDPMGRLTWRAAGARTRIGERDADLVCFRDIRETAAQATAHETEIAKLRGMLDAVPVAVWLRDEDLKIEDCNRAYVEAVEAESREAAIRDSREFTGGSRGGPGVTLARNVQDTGVAQDIQQHVVVDGARKLWEIHEVPLESGSRLAGFALDLTRSEDAEIALERHVAAHGEVLEKLSTAIAIYGPDRKVKFFNRAFTDLWNFDAAWLRSGPEIGEVLEVMRERRQLPETADFPAFKAERINHFTSLLEPLEELLHLPNNTAIRQMVTPHPLGGLLYTYEDVTDRLALERSYNTLIDVQRESLDNLAEGVGVFGGDGRLKLSNPVFASLWGTTEESLEGEPHIADLVENARALYETNEDWEVVKSRLVGMITSREEVSGRFQRADGRHLEYAVIALPDGSVLARYLDVTDSTQVERALRERAEGLEQADRLKSEFIANVSYELRTPLNTIIGFTEILDNQYFGELTPRQKEYSAGILEASQRLLLLINDILELASIEAGRIALDIGPVDAKAVVDSVYTISHEYAREQELNFEVDCPANIGMLEADERRLKHALYNLVSNAIKFTPAGGTVTLRARRDGRFIVFSVTDTGIGIPEDERSHVFDKFVRGRDADGRQVGVGLGLSLVKSLVELHGGAVAIDSGDTGTTVICTLPDRATPVETTPEDGSPDDVSETSSELARKSA
jgi:signal transduction histidine kinase